MILWTIINLFFAFISASIGEYVSRDAEGSGIPELKAILAGVNIYKYLSFPTILGKWVGLTAAFCASFNIGKIGPFCHISAGIANKLAKLRPFNEIQNT